MSTCDGCGVEGVVTDDLDAVTREDGKPFLMAGKSDGSDLHHTYCEDCAAVPARKSKAALV